MPYPTKARDAAIHLGPEEDVTTFDPERTIMLDLITDPLQYALSKPHEHREFQQILLNS